MRWIQACLHHRLAIYLSSIAVCIAGLVCLYVMPITPYPATSQVGFTISLNYPGANAATVQAQVTTKVVAALSGTPNIQNISASSMPGSARIILDLNKTDKMAVLQTQMQVLQAISASHLPSTVSKPDIDTSSSLAMLQRYFLTSRQLSLFQIDNYVTANLDPVLSTIPGVKVMHSNQDPLLRVALNASKIAHYALSPLQLAPAINAAYQAQPLGKLYLAQQPYLLRLAHPLHSIPDFLHLVIGYDTGVPQSKQATPSAASNLVSAGQPIRLQDIATVSLEPKVPFATSFSSFNGVNGDSVALVTRTVSNPFQVHRIAEQLVARLRQHLPADLSIKKVTDRVDAMRAEFNEVLFTIALASLLVLAIAWIFLGQLRATLMPIITIPICLSAAIIVVTLLGFSLNVISLLAMVLAIGLVVDDAIVVVENITRHAAAGMSRIQAIMHGSADITLTIVGITTTLLAVYLPIMFCQGRFVELLTAFALPLAAAVACSGLVALTLVPVLCQQILVLGPPTTYQKMFDGLLKRVIRAYHKLLSWALEHRLSLLSATVLLVVVVGYLDLQLPQRFYPQDPNGAVSIQVDAGPQDTIMSIRQTLEKFSKFYQAKQVMNYSIDVQKDLSNGQLQGMLNLQYSPQWLHQVPAFTRSINQWIKQQRLLNSSTRMRVVASHGSGDDFDITLYSDQGSAVLHKVDMALVNLMRASKFFSEVKSGISPLTKQFAFHINRVKAARLGVSVSAIKQLLAYAYAGYTLQNQFSIHGLTVPVRMQMQPSVWQDPNALQQLQVSSHAGKYYPLSELVKLQMVAKPVSINTYNNQAMVHLSANFAPGYSMSDAIPYMNQLLATHAAGVSYQYTDAAKDYLTGSYQTLFIIILGVLAIYFVLALLFRSLLDPFIILLTVPCSVVFGAASLYLFGGSLHLYSTLALITLIGLISKHGVLIVQFANHELHRGATVRQSIFTATHDRFRPIIMTTLAMTLGALPLLLSRGLGYVARQDLAVVLIGGLVIGTLFSLFIVPLVYSLLKRERLNSASSNTAEDVINA